MTLVIAASGPKSIWLLTDRRLTYEGRAPKEDGRKLLFLDTTDGVALLGYSGLGATSGGVEPSDWMERVLRGRNHPLKDSLLVLSQAVQHRIPEHLKLLKIREYPFHNIIIPAFLQGEPKLYTIDLFRPEGKDMFVSGIVNREKEKQLQFGGSNQFIVMGGSGATSLRSSQTWRRKLLQFIQAHDSGRISPRTVATQFAHLNYGVHKKNKTVGPRCIVAWRLCSGGGGHEFFTGAEVENHTAPVSLPSIARGIPLSKVAEAILPHFLKAAEAAHQGQEFKIDTDALNAAAALVPDEPDETLK